VGRSLFGNAGFEDQRFIATIVNMQLVEPIGATKRRR